jgi:hypothetical protein
MISSSSADRPIARNGKVIEDTMEAAVLSSMSGKPINMQMPIQLTSAQFQATIAARERNVVMAHKDKMATVIKMVVTSILSEMEIRNSMDLDPAIQSILLAPLR